jgi:hypothetical protein
LSLSFQYAIAICKLKHDLNKKILNKHADIDVYIFYQPIPKLELDES